MFTCCDCLILRSGVGARGVRGARGAGGGGCGAAGGAAAVSFAANVCERAPTPTIAPVYDSAPALLAATVTVGDAPADDTVDAGRFSAVSAIMKRSSLCYIFSLLMCMYIFYRYHYYAILDCDR